jgi:hypothetical protein
MQHTEKISKIEKEPSKTPDNDLKTQTLQNWVLIREWSTTRDRYRNQKHQVDRERKDGGILANRKKKIKKKLRSNLK